MCLLRFLRSCGVGVLVWGMTLDRGKASYSEPKGRSRSYPSVALRHQRGRLEWSYLFVAETTYLPPRRTMTSYTTLRKEAPHELRKKRNKNKKYIRALHKPRR